MTAPRPWTTRQDDTSLIVVDAKGVPVALMTHRPTMRANTALITNAAQVHEVEGWSNYATSSFWSWLSSDRDIAPEQTIVNTIRAALLDPCNPDRIRQAARVADLLRFKLRHNDEQIVALVERVAPPGVQDPRDVWEQLMYGADNLGGKT